MHRDVMSIYIRKSKLITNFNYYNNITQIHEKGLWTKIDF